MAKSCPNCGSQVKDKAKFCPVCGACFDNIQAVPQNIEPTAEPKNNKKKNSKAPLIISVIVALLAVAAAVFLIIKQPWNKNEKEKAEWQIKVPNVISAEVDKAQDTLTESTLHGLICDKVEDEKSAVDLILNQNPVADTTVCKGSIVDLTLSAGKEKAFLPDVTGYTFEYANKLLSDAGFKVKQEQLKNGKFAPDSVGEQSVKSGYVDKGQEITVKVAPKKTAAEELVTVPNITGMDIEKAKAELKKVGLYLAVNVAQYSDTAPANQVLSQNKGADSQAKKGETVLVTISLGQKKVYVPDVTYRNVETAKKMLEDAGLIVIEERAESKKVAKDTVISQSTDAGTAVPEKSEVTITVSDGFEVEVPKVKGLTESEAVAKLLESELAVKVEYVTAGNADIGVVTKQNPKSGEKAQLGTVVTIKVKAEEALKPDINENTANGEAGSSDVKSKPYGSEYFVTPTKAELESFIDNCYNFDFYAFQYEEGSLSMTDVTERVVFDVMYGMYFNYYDDYNFETEKSDPLNKFVSYRVGKGENVDWLLKNIFNIKNIDHNYQSDKSYYYEGNYYAYGIEAGDFYPGADVVKYEKLDDGRYNFYISYREYNSSTDTFEASKNPKFKIKAALKEIDGKRYWSFYSVSYLNRFELVDESMTWEEAKKYCENKGGHLAVINDYNEQERVTALIETGTKNSYWIGGKRSGDSFEWITGENFSYINWAGGEPNNCQKSGGEDCLMVYKNSNPMAYGSLGEWNDVNGDGTCGEEKFFGKENFGFICEYETE